MAELSPDRDIRVEGFQRRLGHADLAGTPLEALSFICNVLSPSLAAAFMISGPDSLRPMT